jgi:hypothetical protein
MHAVGELVVLVIMGENLVYRKLERLNLKGFINSSEFDGIYIQMQSVPANTNNAGPSATVQCQNTTCSGSGSRRLKAVLVIDKKVQKHLKVREMCINDITNISALLNVKLQVVFPFLLQSHFRHSVNRF